MIRASSKLHSRQRPTTHRQPFGPDLLEEYVTRLLLLIAVLQLTSLSEAAEPLWTVTECVGAPSHALYDAESDALYVSQISGEGDARDGVGTVSRLGLDGTMRECDWVSGLDAPKGIALHKKFVWVTDIDRVHRIDARTAEVVECLEVPRAKFLTGIAIDADGAVYLADMLASRIYHYRDGRFVVHSSGSELESPSGLAFDENRLIVAPWGLTTDYTTKVPGRLLSVERQKARPLTKPLGNLYGLISDGAGGWLTSDFSSGKIFHYSTKAGIRELLQLDPGVGGISYVPSKNLLVVPELTENRISAYDMKGILSPDSR